MNNHTSDATFRTDWTRCKDNQVLQEPLRDQYTTTGLPINGPEQFGQETHFPKQDQVKWRTHAGVLPGAQGMESFYPTL